MDPLFADVLVDIATEEIDRPFTYKVPQEFQSQIALGSTVLVSFGKRQEIGYIIGLSSQTTLPSVNEILSVVDENPVFTQEMVELSSWISDYYLSTQVEALRLCLPPGRRRKVVRKIALVTGIEADVGRIELSKREQQILEILRTSGKEMLAAQLKDHLKGKNFYSAIKKLEAKGLVKNKYEIAAPRINPKYEERVELTCNIDELDLKGFGKTPGQMVIVEELSKRKEAISVRELLVCTGASRQSLKALEKKGLIRLYKESVPRRGHAYSNELTNSTVDYQLNLEQKVAVEDIKKCLEKGNFEAFLLQGVTGSGKTEVYLQAIAHAIKLGRTAIVIVPEIVLTAQMVERFKKRFGENVAVMHSGLSEGERFDQWQAINRGLHSVVVGARSALFAPVKNLGIIVVDEEQETSYKQNRSPRYHAREVAVKRASLNNAVVILGSATPSIESKYRAESGEFKLLALPKRVEERAQPSIEIVDMRKREQRSILHQKLCDEMSSALSVGDKVILFLNRRGFASFLVCRDCGLVARCIHCAVSLTYHRFAGRGERGFLKCHHCGSKRLPPKVCPRCNSHKIGYFGLGTQQVEAELKKLYPQHKTIRMDTDALSRKNTYIQKLIEFKSSNSAILLGTQMIAKGLDFPEVTLVGVVNADTALNLPDFRASERTFQLLMQVSGRAGRGGRPGKVIIQTYAPEHYAIEGVKSGSYDWFYRREMVFRKELAYPPFSRIINILFSGKDEERVSKAAVQLADYLSQEGINKRAEVLGPSSAPIPKIKGRYRWHLILKSQSDEVKKSLREWIQRGKTKKMDNEISITIDVDPVWLL